MQARLDRLRRWSYLLDSAFEVPGVGMRVGWDPILGLIPGLGDLVTPLYSILIVTTAVRLGVPRVVQLRMVLNVVIDALVGSVPLLGDLFDAGWKANEWNMRLLDRHAWTIRPASAGDWLFVGSILVVVILAALLPLAVLLLLGYALGWSRA